MVLLDVRPLLALCLAMALAACGSEPTSEMSNNQRNGTAAGTVGGAAVAAMLLAAGPVGIAVGAASGALKGYAVGNFLDGDEKARAEATAERAAKTGQPAAWRKRDLLLRTVSKGSVKPGRAYRDTSGQLCRRIAQSVTKGDKTERSTVIFCKGAHGWSALETQQARASAQ